MTDRTTDTLPVGFRCTCGLTEYTTPAPHIRCEACSGYARHPVYAKVAAPSASTLAGSPEQQSYVAWLIESSVRDNRDNVPAQWLVSTLGDPQWTTDANAAVKFDTEGEAHREIMQRGGPLSMRAPSGFCLPTEHRWIVVQPDRPGAPPTLADSSAITRPSEPANG